jgi:hypothetical protein
MPSITPNLIKPICHLNGTGAGDLRDAYVNAYHAAVKAREALADCGPNGRDYYCHPEPGAMAKAARQHADRAARIEAVAQELMDLAVHCDGFAKDKGL